MNGVGTLQVAIVLAGVFGSVAGGSYPVVPTRSSEITFQRDITTDQDAQSTPTLVLFGQRFTGSSSPYAVVSAARSRTIDDAEVRLMERLTALSALRDGDLAPGSKEIPADVLSDLRLLGGLAGHISAVATFDGAVALEWRAQDVEYTAEIQPGHRLFMCTDNTITDELDEVVLDFELEALERFLTTGDWNG